MNRAVPEEIAILGCNNEEPICEHGSTPLSSISRNMHQVGACAAHTLNQMMNREMTEHTEVLIPPECVVRRASTDTLAIDDPRIAKAVHFLHANLHQIEGIEVILDVLHVSRRWLEYAFRKELNVSPYRYLLNLRLQKAQELLSGSKDISIKEIADRCGFSCSKRLSVVMRREIGCGPTEYRKRTHSK
jgi:LacI family transcriptional regulator